MKKKYSDMIFKASDYAQKVPRLSVWGATQTVSSYSKAYEDFSYTADRLNLIIQGVKKINELEKSINRFKGDPDMDIASLRYSINFEQETMEKALTEIIDFVTEREQNNWQ